MHGRKVLRVVGCLYENSIQSSNASIYFQGGGLSGSKQTRTSDKIGKSLVSTEICKSLGFQASEGLLHQKSII